MIQEVQGRLQPGLASHRPLADQLADQVQHMRLALPRRIVGLHLVTEGQQAHLVVVLQRREHQQRRDFDNQLELGPLRGTEDSRGRHVDQKQHGQLAFLAKPFDKAAARPRRDVPVDRADIVPRLVLADFVKLHPAAAKDALVLAREQIVHGSVGHDLDAADAFQDVGNGQFRHGSCKGKQAWATALAPCSESWQSRPRPSSPRPRLRRSG